MITGINKLVRPLGLRISRVAPPNNGYIGTQETIAAAEKMGLPLEAYLEHQWNQIGETAAITDQMRRAGCFKDCSAMTEIGPGTGIYLARAIAGANPASFEIYETAPDWREWLAQQYAPLVTACEADGQSLSHSETSSRDLVCAHGVFVYLRALNTFEYCKDAARVCRPGGFFVFDCYTEANFPPATIDAWIATPLRYPVLLPHTTICAYLDGSGFELVTTFPAKCGANGVGTSTYFIFRRRHDKNPLSP